MAETERPSAADVTVGDARELTVSDLERRDFVRYAGASGDFNPIHYDEPFAREAGNPSVFAQGMLTAGFASKLVTDWFGVGAVRTFETRFRSRVFPGETVTVRGEVIEVTVGERATVALDAVNQDGEAVLTGEAVVDVAGDGG
ncbi:MaoC/PaaZ C-terminal domain-containing protein [Halomarina halobia]|uniref:MaoC/PaaZ C-terminal domain-containing protein n=1 Tax=Halomarina halobia TaxID=3033386 RepID=A0ABD6ADM2_9EURY